MVTKDKEGIETWIYDKASNEYITTNNYSYGTAILFGASGSQKSGKSSQRTMTLIIKFKDNVVSDYTYNTSSF